MISPINSGESDCYDSDKDPKYSGDEQAKITKSSSSESSTDEEDVMK